MVLASVVAAVLLEAIGGGVFQEISRPVPLSRLKPADGEMRRLISDGFERSATFRALVDAIHKTDGVVVVQMGRCANGRFRSCVSDVGGNAQVRTIRVKVDTRTTDDRLIATIAHELQHVLEILGDATVRDAKSTLALYRRIASGDCGKGLSEACETDAAVRIEAVVNDELAERGRR